MTALLSPDDLSALAETLREAAERLAAAVTSAEARPQPSAAAYAKQILAARGRIGGFIDADLFADPARDILLDLFVAGEEGTRISISSCCIAAAVPPTTALRWIKMLKKRGLVNETVDPADGRRKWLSLSPDAHKAVRDYVMAVSGMFADRG
jgi:hypothetical protein